MSNSGRNRASQLVELDVSVEFTKHTLLLSAHERKQIDSANERIVIVTDNCCSVVNWPIKDEIVPLS